MTIKEIENLSGMTRANIRFYETEGLLRPARNSNGYRNYSEEDLNTLRKIRLFPHASPQSGGYPFRKPRPEHAHRGSFRAYPSSQEERGGSRTLPSICSQICADGTDYRTLDAEHYLSLMDSPSDAPELKEDTLMKVTSPWKRFFARSIDFSILNLITDCFLAMVLHINVRSFSAGILIYDWIAPMLLLLLLEPVLLTLTGQQRRAKLLFGLRVNSEIAPCHGRTQDTEQL